MWYPRANQSRAESPQSRTAEGSGCRTQDGSGPAGLGIEGRPSGPLNYLGSLLGALAPTKLPKPGSAAPDPRTQQPSLCAVPDRRAYGSQSEIVGQK